MEGSTGVCLLQRATLTTVVRCALPPSLLGNTHVFSLAPSLASPYPQNFPLSSSAHSSRTRLFAYPQHSHDDGVCNIVFLSPHLIPRLSSLHAPSPSLATNFTPPPHFTHVGSTLLFCIFPSSAGPPAKIFPLLAHLPLFEGLSPVLHARHGCAFCTCLQACSSLSSSLACRTVVLMHFSSIFASHSCFFIVHPFARSSWHCFHAHSLVLPALASVRSLHPCPDLPPKYPSICMDIEQYWECGFFFLSKNKLPLASNLFEKNSHNFEVQIRAFSSVKWVSRVVIDSRKVIFQAVDIGNRSN